MPPCLTDAQIVALVYGLGPSAELDTLAAHVDGCTSCEAKIEELECRPEQLLAIIRRCGGDAATTVDDAHGRQDPSILAPVPTRAIAPAADHGPNEPPNADVPEYIGRYRVVRQLGRGNFGTVFLAQDPELNRSVAIKVAHSHRTLSSEDVELYKKEARILAALDHPNILRVYDVGRTEAGTCYVVAKYVEGTDLADFISRGRPAAADSVRLIVNLAMGLDHAHRHKLVHRDIKPGNILLDVDGNPCLADFGLALREEDFDSGPTFAGTVPYMSPEQARGESHRVDGRSDIYSLGVVFYRLLTGRRPHTSGDMRELLREIISAEVPPLRQLDPLIAVELERICLKMVAKRATDRYQTAADLVADLRAWEGGATAAVDSVVPPSPLVPKGLRSFGASDAGSFLDLLPGPRDREGLPESVAFWKRRIESVGEDAFSVGLLLGSSGTGKSSLIRAGLLPRLGRQVIAVYVEAEAAHTAERLLAVLRAACPQLPAGRGLRDTMEAVRRGRDLPAGKKVLIVLDQFERLLAGPATGAEEELLDALWHCDGKHAQALLVARDDFALAVAQFFTRLEVPLVQGQNFAAVDRFDREHARNVLIALGRAFGRLPADNQALDRAQAQFLDRAVEELTADGKLIPVQLAMFAEMFKGRPWTQASYRAIGGSEGIGLAFLESLFTSPATHLRLRAQQGAARAVLRALLPPPGIAIKGAARIREDLIAAAGPLPDGRAFDELLEVLDGDLRLITPVEADDGPTRFQLAHDHLVPALRSWLILKQRETLRGRAAARLAERAGAWNLRSEPRQLPTWWEMPGLLLLTRRRFWNEPEQRLMRAAGRYHGLRTAAGAIGMVLLASLAFWGWWNIEDRQRSEQSGELVKHLLSATPAKVPEILVRLDPHQERLSQSLAAAAQDSTRTSLERRRARLGLAASDTSQANVLAEELLDPEIELAEVLLLRDSLLHHLPAMADLYWKTLQDEKTDAGRRFRAGLALAGFDPHSERWPAQAEFLAGQMLRRARANPSEYAPMVEALRLVATILIPPLHRLFRSPAVEDERSLALSMLADYASEDADTLSELLLDADILSFSRLIALVQRHAGKVIPRLENELKKELEPESPEAILPTNCPEPDAATLEMLDRAGGLVEAQYALCQTLPLSQLQELSDRLRACGYRPARVRPYAEKGGTRAAALWTRDRRESRLAIGLTSEELTRGNIARAQEGFEPVDVAAYLAGAGTAGQERYVGVWSAALPGAAERQIIKGVADAELKKIVATMEHDDFLQLTHQVLDLPDGRRQHSSLWVKPLTGLIHQTQRFEGPASDYAGGLFLARLQTDVAISAGERPRLLRERMAESLRQTEEELRTKPRDPNLRFKRGEAQSYLGREDEALAEWGSLIEEFPAYAWMWMRPRGMLHARRGNLAQARADLEAFRQKSKKASELAYFEAFVGACEGDTSGAIRRLEAGVREHAQDHAFLYAAANALALISEVATKRNEVEARAYADRAVDLLAQALRAGKKLTSAVHADPDFEILRQHPKFLALTATGQLRQRATALWQPSLTEESTELHGLTPAEHRGRWRELGRRGFRPAAIAVFGDSRTGLPEGASVWHRPLMSEARKQQLANRQANGALGLLRLGQPDQVWPLFRPQPDPRLTSEILSRLTPAKVELSLLCGRLRQEPDPGARQALILGVGQHDSAGLSAQDRAEFLKQLSEEYRHDPDVGVHSATEWVLRRWGLHQDVEKTQAELKSDQPLAGFGWYINHDGDTFSVAGPVEFEMGARPSEWYKQVAVEEQLHRRQIPRRFAIATKEVTNSQFERFLAQNPKLASQYIRRPELSPGADCPVVGVSWLLALEYCRWLTACAGIPAEQQCYTMLAEPGELRWSLKLKQGYLARTGYRLPTEAEWEYAARAGTTSRRSYGWSDELLPEHAWFLPARRADEDPLGSAHPVGRLLPNRMGCFDMLGNAYEWTTTVFDYPMPVVGTLTLDSEQVGAVTESHRLAIRGGSYLRAAEYLRSGFRSRLSATTPQAEVGFRVARTLPDGPAPPASGGRRPNK